MEVNARWEAAELKQVEHPNLERASVLEVSEKGFNRTSNPAFAAKTCIWLRVGINSNTLTTYQWCSLPEESRGQSWVRDAKISNPFYPMRRALGHH